MGAKPSFCFCRPSCSWEEALADRNASRCAVDEEDVIRSLSTMTMADREGLDDTLGEALELLHEAQRLFHQGFVDEAVEKLAAADRAIDESPHSPARRKLKQLSETDPEIADMRQLLHVPTPDEIMERARASSSSSSSPRSSRFFPLASSQEMRETATLSKLEEQLGNVRHLCRAARVFDAHKAFELFRGDLTTAKEMEASSTTKSFANVIESLTQKLHNDPALAKLEALHSRMEAAAALLRLPSDDRGVSIDVKEPRISDLFRLEVKIRFAEGSERDKHGPSTQLILHGIVHNLPASLLVVIAENCEADLFQKQWLKDCTSVEGKPGRPARLYTTLVHYLLSSNMLPVKIEDVLLREFAICAGEGLLPDRGQGVLVVEHRAYNDSKEFEGMPIPAKRKGYIRLKGGMTAFYKTPSAHQGCTNVYAVSRVNLPVPQAILPLGMLKRFAADLIINSIRLLKSGLYDQWDAVSHQERVPMMPDFYKLVEEMVAEKLNA